jgi:transposase
MSALLDSSAVGAYLGIDVAKAKLDVVLHLDDQHSHRVFANSAAGFTALHAWLAPMPAPQVHICLEATGSYSDALADFLYAHSYPLSVLNPAVLVAYRKSEQVHSKTDKLDAELLARYAQQKQPRLWQPFPAEVVALRHLFRNRADVLQMLGQERNRLEAGRLTDWSRAQIQQHLQDLHQRLRAAERQLKAYLKASEQLAPLWQRLQTIPGIGWLTAAFLIALCGDVARFPQVGALVSLAGLALKEHDSGSSVHRRACIDRQGHSELRQLLYWCAITAMRTDPQFQAFAQRLRERGKPNKVIIVAVMRKLLHIVYGVWKGHSDYDPAKVLGPVA